MLFLFLMGGLTIALGALVWLLGLNRDFAIGAMVAGVICEIIVFAATHGPS